MHRFYVEQKIENDTVSISDREQLHHLKDVLRLGTGDEITVFDGTGNEYLCLVTVLAKDEAVLEIKAKKPARKAKQRLVVACAITKGDKMDDIVDGLTQLGVDSIIPLETKRVVVRLDEDKKAARVERWKRIAQSAAQQSQRNTVPVVEPVTAMEKVLLLARDFDLKLVPALTGNRKPFKEVLDASCPQSIFVLIGPEGDFTPQEIELAEKAGFLPISLGESVLRVGTAAIAVASYIVLSRRA